MIKIKAIKRYVAAGDKLRVKYKGGTVEGSLTRGKEYEAAYGTTLFDSGDIRRDEKFNVLDDSGYYSYYNNDEFEVLEVLN